MNPIATQPAAQKRPGFLRRLARRFCEARVQSVWREIEHHRDFLDAVGGRIEPVHTSADPEFTVAFEFLHTWSLGPGTAESIDPFGELANIGRSQEGSPENAMPGNLNPPIESRVKLAA